MKPNLNNSLVKKEIRLNLKLGETQMRNVHFERWWENQEPTISSVISSKNQ